MEYLAVAAAVALVLPGSLFLIPSKRRLAIRLSLGVGALFAGLAVLTLGYYGVIFLALGRSPDFLDIDSCLDAGGMWNYATRTCEHSRWLSTNGLTRRRSHARKVSPPWRFSETTSFSRA